MNRQTAERVLLEAFEEIALVLGGVFAVHEVEDGVIWQAAKSLSVICRKAREELRSSGSGGSRAPADRKPEPHPAIVELLSQISRDRRESLREEVGSP